MMTLYEIPALPDRGWDDLGAAMAAAAEAGLEMPLVTVRAVPETELELAAARLAEAAQVVSHALAPVMESILAAVAAANAALARLVDEVDEAAPPTGAGMSAPAAPVRPCTLDDPHEAHMRTNGKWCPGLEEDESDDDA